MDSPSGLSPMRLRGNGESTIWDRMRDGGGPGKGVIPTRGDGNGQLQIHIMRNMKAFPKSKDMQNYGLVLSEKQTVRSMTDSEASEASLVYSSVIPSTWRISNCTHLTQHHECTINNKSGQGFCDLL